MNQTGTLLKLRLTQAYRYLSEIGFGLIAVALFILTGVLMSAVQSIMNSPAHNSLIAAIALLLMVEFYRKDQIFLASIFKNKSSLIRFKFFENLLIIVPILIFQLIILQWTVSLGLVLICLLVGLLTSNVRKSSLSNRKTSLSFLPLSIFEIKFYFEKRVILLCITWILLCLGAIHISIWILGIFIFCGLPIEIYTPLESRIMFQYRPQFVLYKIINALKFFYLFFIPPTLVSAIFYEGNLWLFLYALVAITLATILAIGKKYHQYYGVLERLPSTTSIIILTFLMLIPGGILITLIASIYYYIKAENHLKSLYAIH